MLTDFITDVLKCILLTIFYC